MRGLFRSSFAGGVLILTGALLAASHNFDGPPYSPEEALSTFEIAEGFRIELYAAEPLIMDPVAMEVDESGTVYVVEMPGYPLDATGAGRVVTLRDTNEDGLPDERTVFADDLTFANGIMRWKDGIVVTDAPDVLFLADRDGDGRAEVREVLLTGFAAFHPQHNVNHPTYGLNNEIYLANLGTWDLVVYDSLLGDKGEIVRYPAHPGAPTLPRNADGRVVRFRPDNLTLEAQSGESQFGLTFDAWGHPFYTHNTYHIYHEVVAARYLRRNPELLIPDATANIAAYGYPAEVYPITEDPRHQLLTDVGVMTSACGLTYYLGGLFPASMGDIAFVAEPAQNLVHAMRITESGSTFTASRLLEGQEFLASRDSWFRPVNFYVGPDGALYLIDYYREIIDHPEWLSEEVVRSGILENGKDRGRIYRIVPTDVTTPPNWTNKLSLGEASDADLIQALDHPNLWHRRTAQRLLVDRRSPATIEPLARLARQGRTPEGRVHALWTLEGLDALDAALIRHALQDEAPGVRENAIRLAELHLADLPDAGEWLAELADDADPMVRYQLLAALGHLHSPAALAARHDLLFQNLSDEWMQVAALSAESLDVSGLYQEATRRLSAQETPGHRALFERLGVLIGTGYPENGPLLSELIHGLTSAPLEPAWWEAATLEGLTEGLRRNRPPVGALASERTTMLDRFSTGASPTVQGYMLDFLDVLGLPEGAARAHAVDYARGLAKDRSEDVAARANAVQLLFLTGSAEHTALFEELIDSTESAIVQRASLQALRATGGDATGDALLARWNQLHPEAIDDALSILTKDQNGVRLLLDAVEQDRINPASVSWQQRVSLMMNEDEALRERARRLLAGEEGRRDLILARYKPALRTAGNTVRGRAVFERACSMCHRAGDLGTSFGPDLGTIRNRTAESILTDILIPSRYIADGFSMWTVHTRDGAVIQGLITAETPTAVTLSSPSGITTTLARNDIASRTASRISPMPIGMENQVTPEEMTDLITFLKAGG